MLIDYITSKFIIAKWTNFFNNVCFIILAILLLHCSSEYPIDIAGTIDKYAYNMLPTDNFKTDDNHLPEFTWDIDETDYQKLRFVISTEQQIADALKDGIVIELKPGTKQFNLKYNIPDATYYWWVGSKNKSDGEYTYKPGETGIKIIKGPLDTAYIYNQARFEDYISPETYEMYDQKGKTIANESPTVLTKRGDGPYYFFVRKVLGARLYVFDLTYYLNGESRSITHEVSEEDIQTLLLPNPNGVFVEETGVMFDVPDVKSNAYGDLNIKIAGDADVYDPTPYLLFIRKDEAPIIDGNMDLEYRFYSEGIASDIKTVQSTIQTTIENWNNACPNEVGQNISVGCPFVYPYPAIVDRSGAIVDLSELHEDYYLSIQLLDMNKVKYVCENPTDGSKSYLTCKENPVVYSTSAGVYYLQFVLNRRMYDEVTDKYRIVRSAPVEYKMEISPRLVSREIGPYTVTYQYWREDLKDTITDGVLRFTNSKVARYQAGETISILEVSQMNGQINGDGSLSLWSGDMWSKDGDFKKANITNKIEVGARPVPLPPEGHPYTVPITEFFTFKIENNYLILKQDFSNQSEAIVNYKDPFDISF